MRKYVKKKISECAKCNRNKISRHAFYGQFKLLKTPSGVWKLIAFNFMIKLLLFKELFIKIEYDSILVITCRFTKYKYFISYLKISTAEDLIYIFLKNIHSNYGLSEEIISDKNKFFISNFWKLLITQCYNAPLSIAYPDMGITNKYGEFYIV